VVQPEPPLVKESQAAVTARKALLSAQLSAALQAQPSATVPAIVKAIGTHAAL